MVDSSAILVHSSSPPCLEAVLAAEEEGLGRAPEGTEERERVKAAEKAATMISVGFYRRRGPSMPLAKPFYDATPFVYISLALLGLHFPSEITSSQDHRKGSKK